MILNFKTRLPIRLRDIEFTKSYCMYDDINELVNSYTQEIIESVLDLNRGEISENKLRTILKRAQYASYKRGLRDGKEAAKISRIIPIKRRGKK